MSRLTHTHTEYVIDLSFGCSVLSCSAPDFISVSIQFEQNTQNLKMLSDPLRLDLIRSSSIILLKQMWMVSFGTSCV